MNDNLLDVKNLSVEFSSKDDLYNKKGRIFQYLIDKDSSNVVIKPIGRNTNIYLKLLHSTINDQ